MNDISLGLSVIQFNPVSEAIQELEILFNTNYTELIGDTRFGSDFYRFVNTLTLNTDEIEDYTKQMINANCDVLPSMGYDVNVRNEYDETKYEIVLYVDIIIQTDTQQHVQTYNLSNLLYMRS